MKRWRLPIIVLALSLAYLFLDLTALAAGLCRIAIFPVVALVFLIGKLFGLWFRLPVALVAPVSGLGPSLLRTLVFALIISPVVQPWHLWQLKRDPKYLKLGIAAIVIYLIASVGFYFFLAFIFAPIMSRT